MASLPYRKSNSRLYMEKELEKPLLIYSASAGSGKTYALVKTYLELILKGTAQPQAFAKIIAMTFTNKAALEMKTRIVAALADLANPLRDHNNSTKAKKYQTEISTDFSMSIEEIEKKSLVALTYILHQYEDFYVMTIDKFNLRLIRSFAMDLNLEANFKVVIDETDIKQRVVDDFMNEIDPEVSSLLSKIFIQIADERIEDGDGWNFERVLTDYLSILDKEEAITLIKQAEESDDSQETIQQLKVQIHYNQGKIQENASNFIQRITPELEVSEAPKTQLNSINKLIEKFNKEGNGEDVKLTDTQIRYIDNEELPEPLLSLLSDFYTNYLQYAGEFEKLQKIKGSYYYIQLLKKINNRLKEYRETEQVIRISEFNQMISDLLKNESTPYIYEKLGVRYNHFLLDEFQDTSRLQWQNIVPLVHESISQGHKNLIVGDPKQSIYRFRGGVADQFVALPAIYNPDNDAYLNEASRYFTAMGKMDSLDDNYRSSKEVVEFNNFFFSEFIKFIKTDAVIQNDYSNYYNAIHQNPKNESNGFVDLVSIYQKNIKASLNDDDDIDSDPVNIEYLINAVNECLEDGYEKGDICILGDTAKLCNQFALALTEQGHKVVSSDSLAVNSENSVNLCITYLMWRNQPASNLLAKQFAERYLSIRFGDESTVKYMSYIKDRPSSQNPDRRITYFDYKQFVNDYFDNWETFHFPFENLYTLLEQFYKVTSLNELENPYLHHLSDLAFHFDLNNGPDLNAFLEYFEKTGFKSSIQTPENKDAIKIMTAHKSKGLEFKVVIIPQLDSQFIKARSNYLVQLDQQLAYTKLSSNAKSDELKIKYDKEYKAALLDKLNLCYVAFTRPIDRLYVMSIYARNSKASFASSFIHPFVQSEVFQPYIISAEDNGNEGNSYHLQFGQRKKLDATKEIENQGASDAIFVPINISDKLWFPSISLKQQLNDTDESLEKNLRYGRQLHLLLSEIEHFSTVDEMITSFVKKGWVEKEFTSQLIADLNRISTNDMYLKLHKNKTQVINEQSIIISAEEVKRPDKIILKKEETIVLDFKTGLKKPKDLKQVKTYCEILYQMDFPNVRGYVLYTQDMDFVEV